MRRNKKRTLVAAIGVGALVLAGAAAFTNSITDSTATNAPAAYGSLHASGATVTSISYTLSGANPAVVTAVTFVTTGDTSGFHRPGGLQRLGHDERDSAAPAPMTAPLPRPMRAP